MSSASSTLADLDLTDAALNVGPAQLAAAARPQRSGRLRARLRRTTQRLLDQLDEHWDDNQTLANSWPTCW